MSARGSGGKSAGGRGLTTRVKTARGRKSSSTKWLKRQLNDPYVRQAKAAGYRSRAAFKLVELDERYHLLRPGARVVDLGAAPGGWSQVAADKIKPGGHVLAVDIQEIEPLSGVDVLTLDITDESAPARLREALGGGADLVLSDMAAPATGHARTDHLRVVALAELAWEFAEEVLADGGAFVCKVFQGGTEGELLKRIKARCAKVTHAKPPASRKDSAEMYLVAIGFKALPNSMEEAGN